MNAPEQQKLIGAGVKRKEDYRFLTGAGQYTDDVVMPQQSYGVFLRSPHAHARIKRIDLDAAMKSPGVIGIFTGKDMAGENVGGCQSPLSERGCDFFASASSASISVCSR